MHLADIMLNEESQTQKDDTVWVHFCEILVQAKLSCGDKSDQWLPGGRRKLSGVLEMFFILTGVMVLQGRTFVKTHQTVHLKWVHSISCNLYLFYWKGSEKKENIVTDQSGWEGLGEGKPIRVGTLVWGDWISVTTVHSPAGSALPRGPSSWPAPSQNPSHRMAPRNVCCGMKRGGPFPFTFFV